MMATVQDWFRERPKNAPGIFNLFSFLLFSSLCVLAAAFLPGYWLLFGALIAMDGLGTLVPADFFVSADRAIFFLAFVVLAMLKNPSGIFILTIEILGVIAALDFSFLLRKVDGTSVDRDVLARRLKSYAYTVLPAFFVTYLFLYVYSQNIQFNASEAVVAFGLASVGALIVVYAIVRFLFSLERRAQR
jgi:hypothetical protein